MADDQDTDFEPQARPPSRAEPPRPQREQVAAGRSISVDINPRQLRVTPGVTESATVSIRYHGSVIGELSLRLSGEPATWTRVVPDVLNVYPDTEVEATLRLDPPRASSLAAGLVELVLEVSSSADAAATTVLRRSIEIAPFDELSAAAAGSTNLSDPREAVLPIKVRNLGNRLALVGLRAADPGALEFVLSATSVPLQAGEETTVWVTARPRQPITAGPPRLHPFTVYVSSDRTPSVAIDGRFEQLPVPPPAPAPPPPAPPALVPAPPAAAWHATAQPVPKRRSRLVPALLVLLLLAGGGVALAYAAGVWQPKPTEAPTDRPTVGPTDGPHGGPDISGDWALGEISGSIRQIYGDKPGFGLDSLNVSSGGLAAWGVHLSQGFSFYQINCAGTYDAGESSITPSPATLDQGQLDDTSRLISRAICGWDLDSNEAADSFSVSVSGGFPSELTFTNSGDTELKWQKMGF